MAAGLRDLHLTAKWAKPPLVRLMCCICLNEAALRDTFTASGPLHLMLLCNLFSQQKEDGQQFLFFFFFKFCKEFSDKLFPFLKAIKSIHNVYFNFSEAEEVLFTNFWGSCWFFGGTVPHPVCPKRNIVLTAPFTSEMYTWVENIVSL